MARLSDFVQPPPQPEKEDSKRKKRKALPDEAPAPVAPQAGVDANVVEEPVSFKGIGIPLEPTPFRLQAEQSAVENLPAALKFFAALTTAIELYPSFGPDNFKERLTWISGHWRACFLDTADAAQFAKAYRENHPTATDEHYPFDD